MVQDSTQQHLQQTAQSADLTLQQIQNMMNNCNNAAGNQVQAATSGQTNQAQNGGQPMAQQLDPTQLAQIQSIIQQIQTMITPQIDSTAGGPQQQTAAQNMNTSYGTHQICDSNQNLSSEEKNNQSQTAQNQQTGTNTNLTLNNQAIINNLQAIQRQITQGQQLSRDKITRHYQPLQLDNSANLNINNQSMQGQTAIDSNQQTQSNQMDQALLSNSSQQPQALTGQMPNSTSPPTSTVQLFPAMGSSQAQGSHQAQSNRQFFELAPQNQNHQFHEEGTTGEQQVTGNESCAGERVYQQSGNPQGEGPHNAAEQQSFSSVNNLMNQMQNVIKEGEQVQNELTHYEEELKTFENQFQMISTDQQKQVQEQVDQSVAILNQQIDSRKMEIQNLQDKYNQLQQILLKKSEQQTANLNQQQSAFAANQGQVYQGAAQVNAALQFSQQPQDSSKVQDVLQNLNDGQEFRRNQQQINQNIINRGFKTPQTIKESASIHNETTPKAHATNNKVFRSQEVGREPERQMNEFGNQQFIAQIDGSGTFGGINQNTNVNLNKNQMMLRPEEQINNFLQMNSQQNLVGSHGAGSFNSGVGNNSGADQGLNDGSGNNQQIGVQKQKIIIGSRGAPLVQTNVHQKMAVSQSNNTRMTGSAFQVPQSQHSSQMHVSSDFNQVQAQQMLNAQTVQLLNNMSAQNNSAQRLSSHHNSGQHNSGHHNSGFHNSANQNSGQNHSAQRHGSFSSNQSGGLLNGSQQRLNEGQLPQDIQQLLNQALQSTKTGEPMQLQLGEQQISNQQSQSAQRVQEMDIANRLVQNLQGLYKLSDRELEQYMSVLGQSQSVNQQQEQIGRKLIEQLTIQAQAKLQQLRERNNTNSNLQNNNQDQYQELQRLFQRRAAQNNVPVPQQNPGVMQMGGQSQNRGMPSQQWSSIQEQASILSKKLIQQNSAAILRSASRMQEQQLTNSAGGLQQNQNSAYSGQAIQGGSASSQNGPANHVQHFQLTDNNNVLKQPTNFQMPLTNPEGPLASVGAVSGHQINNDHLMNIDSLQQNVITQKNSITDVVQMNSQSKIQQRGIKQATGLPQGGAVKGKDGVQPSSSGLENVIRFKDREYQFYGKGIISDEQAMEIFDKLLKEQKDPTQSLRTLTQWKDDETHLFQYGLFAYMVKNSKFVEDFDDNDWEQIAEIVPTKDARKCHKRWLFIQKLGGNKTKWTSQEDEILKQLIIDHGAKDWTSISEKLNDALIEILQNASNEDREKITLTARNGKQCRERWLTALDPSIKKSQWTLVEDQEFLEQWLKLGNKWREIANIIEGRTESQVKNRFKLILRREHIQQTKIDPEELRTTIIPKILESIKQSILSGADSQNPKSQSAHRNAEEDNADDSDGSGNQSKQRIKEKADDDNIMNRLDQIDAQQRGGKNKKGGNKQASGSIIEQNADEDYEMD